MLDVCVRSRPAVESLILWAKVTRALFYDLVELGEERDVGGQLMFGVASAGEFFAMADAEQVRDGR